MERASLASAYPSGAEEQTRALNTRALSLSGPFLVSLSHSARLLGKDGVPTGQFVPEKTWSSRNDLVSDWMPGDMQSIFLSKDDLNKEIVGAKWERRGQQVYPFVIQTTDGGPDRRSNLPKVTWLDCRDLSTSQASRL